MWEYFKDYLATESRTELLLIMLQMVSRKTLKEGYLRLKTLWSLFVKIPLGLSSHQIPLGSYCQQYHKGYYGKPLKRYLRPKALRLLFLKIPLGLSSHGLPRNSRKGIVENLKNFPCIDIVKRPTSFFG